MRILRYGDIGREVADLQRRLIANGFKLEQTHIYDDATVSAVRQLQKRGRLVIDGIFGPKSDSYLRGSETGHLLKHADIINASKKLDVDVASVMAVNEVESLGAGFIKPGMPTILFERHIFYRMLREKGIDTAALESRYPGIVNRRPGGYAGGQSEYTRLAAAVDIHRESAYESCSWGAFQIMGFHWELLGFSSAQDLVDYASKDESSQLDIFVRFVMANRAMHKALQEKKWAAFAKLYNGPAYARNFYDIKLARAYQAYKDIEGPA